MKDLNAREALHASVQLRMSARRSVENEESFRKTINIVGGRLSYLTKASKYPDMLGHARHLLDVEKAWLTSQIGLIPDHDDDVMDEVGLAINGRNQLQQADVSGRHSKNGARVLGCFFENS